jgi:hypothetical protein
MIFFKWGQNFNLKLKLNLIFFFKVKKVNFSIFSQFFRNFFTTNFFFKKSYLSTYYTCKFLVNDR